MIPLGREFYKMSGSGNDFVFVDTREVPAGPLVSPEVIGSICSRGTGIGADGVCFLEESSEATIRLVYLNADGSRADLCGNATLCTARLARELGATDGTEFSIETDSGVLGARFRGDTPEIDLPPVQEFRDDAGIPLAAGEHRMRLVEAEPVRGLDHRLEPRAAEPVDRDRRCGHVEPASEGHVTGAVDRVARGLHHVADDRVIHVGARDATPRQGRLRGDHREVGGGALLEGATEGAESGPHRGGEDDVAHHDRASTMPHSGQVTRWAGSTDSPTSE